MTPSIHYKEFETYGDDLPTNAKYDDVCRRPTAGPGPACPAAASSSRQALGPLVYRMEDGTDSLYEECVGPSRYSKGQGECIRIWGLLVGGVLHVTVLPQGTVMNRWEYTWLIENRFPQWLQGQSWPVLVQDREKCLWCDEPQRALEKIGVEIVPWQPKHSADLNAIENAWSFLRARLDQTHPGGETPEPR